MHYKRGFTIIEVVLFLAISGGLAAALILGTGAAIQRQQYKDSVQSYANFLTTQYSRVVSVENDRSDDEKCSIDGASLENRGQSDCVIVGRYISTEDSTAGKEGRVYQTYPVYSLGRGENRQYSIGNSDGKYQVTWSARTRFANQPSSDTIMSILMYRDPDNGSIIIRTSNQRYNTSNIQELFANSGSTDAKEVCVYDTGGWLAGERRSVILGARAASSDAVTLDNASESCNAL